MQKKEVTKTRDFYRVENFPLLQVHPELLYLFLLVSEKHAGFYVEVLRTSRV